MSREVTPIPKTYRAKRKPKRIKPVSAKRAKDNRLRRRVLHQRYGKHPRCHACPVLQAAGIEVGCSGWAMDGHEVLTSGRGGSRVDVANVLPVGRACHRWITEHSKLAEPLGLVRASWDQPLP